MNQDFSEKDRKEASFSNSTDVQTNTYYSIEVVTARTGLGVKMVQRCISYGIINPQTSSQAAELYTENDLIRLRKVRRLVSELGLNWAGVEVVMRLTDELERLQQELNRLREVS